MNSASTFRHSDDCVGCSFRAHGIFCNLPDAAARAIEKIKVTSEVPKGTRLFHEGQPARGIYVVCRGRAKLTTTSAEGKIVIFRVVEPGEAAGLRGLLSDGEYEATMEILEPTRVSYIRRDDLLRLGHQFPEIADRTAFQLARNCSAAYSEIRALGFSRSTPERVARLLLSLVNAQDGESGKRMRIRFTQEEMAEMIGSTRESVSRQLAEFKRQKFIQLKGSLLTILNREALESIVS
jgi:CRP/FNR family cyclic AMP-dependent transcriptional regulator